MLVCLKRPVSGGWHERARPLRLFAESRLLGVARPPLAHPERPLRGGLPSPGGGLVQGAQRPGDDAKEIASGLAPVASLGFTCVFVFGCLFD